MTAAAAAAAELVFGFGMCPCTDTHTYITESIVIDSSRVHGTEKWTAGGNDDGFAALYMSMPVSRRDIINIPNVGTCIPVYVHIRKRKKIQIRGMLENR